MSALLEVKNLKVHFPVKHGLFSRAKDISAFGGLTGDILVVMVTPDRMHCWLLKRQL